MTLRIFSEMKYRFSQHEPRKTISLPFSPSWSKRRELCQHHDEADQRPETSSRRFTERGRHTPRTEERVWDESGEDERTERRERVTQEWSPRPSPVLWLTSAHLSPGQPPPIPTTRIPASAANVPSSAAVTVQTSKATRVQTSTQRRSYLRWGEHSSRAQEVWSAHVGCWWGEEDSVWEAIFQKKLYEERIQSLTALQNRCSWRWGRYWNEWSWMIWNNKFAEDFIFF